MWQVYKSTEPVVPKYVELAFSLWTKNNLGLDF